MEVIVQKSPKGSGALRRFFNFEEIGVSHSDAFFRVFYKYVYFFFPCCVYFFDFTTRVLFLRLFCNIGVFYSVGCVFGRFLVDFLLMIFCHYQKKLYFFCACFLPIAFF